MCEFTVFRRDSFKNPQNALLRLQFVFDLKNRRSRNAHFRHRATSKMRDGLKQELRLMTHVLAEPEEDQRIHDGCRQLHAVHKHIQPAGRFQGVQVEHWSEHVDEGGQLQAETYERALKRIEKYQLFLLQAFKIF